MGKKLDDLTRRFGTFAEQSLAPPIANPGTSGPAELPAKLRGLVRSKDAAEIPLDRIIPDPDQPREAFDEEALGRLAGSLRARGVLQPIRVRWDEGRGAYVLVAGERRWRAAARAGLDRLPCTIQDGAIDPAELLAVQLIENLLREDLQPVEQARGYRRLMDARGWSAGDLARELHVPHSTVLRSLELLDLPEPVQELVERGALAPSAAAEIGRLERPEEQVAVAELAVAGKLTRNEVVAEVRTRRDPAAPRSGGKGRGAPAPKPARKLTKRIYKHEGVKLTLERARGLDDAAEVAALEAALAEARARLDASGLAPRAA